MSLRVDAIWRYPVKSMQGEPVAETPVDGGGIVGDRGYAVIDRSDGRVASAKHPRKWGVLLDCSATYVDPPVPERPVPPVRVALPDGSVVRSDDAGVDAALCALTGRDVTLADVATAGASSYQAVWPAVEGLVPDAFLDQTSVGSEAGETLTDLTLAVIAAPGSFFDVAGLHLVSTSTLRRLAELAADSAVDPRRFRPNVVVETDVGGFVENSWVGATLSLGPDVAATVDMATMRCIMTTLAQPGLPADRRPLRAIAAHNRVEIPGIGTWSCAGVYATVATAGRLRVGDPVEVARPS